MGKTVKTSKSAPRKNSADTSVALKKDAEFVCGRLGCSKIDTTDLDGKSRSLISESKARLVKIEKIRADIVSKLNKAKSLEVKLPKAPKSMFK